MAPTRDLGSKLAKDQTTMGIFFKSKCSASAPTGIVKARTNSRTPTTVDSARVMTDVLLAIQPVHLNNIITKQKNHEYRKYRLRDGVERLWFYETRGTRERVGSAAITHIATIPSNIRRTPGTVPEEPPGLGNSEFNAGMKQSKYGYPILELYKLVTPISLGEMKTTWGMGGAPMGWSYVKDPMWQDRWGEAEGRCTRVEKIF